MQTFRHFLENYANEEYLREFFELAKIQLEELHTSLDYALKKQVGNAFLHQKCHANNMWDIAYNIGTKTSYTPFFMGKLKSSLPKIPASEVGMKAKIKWNKDESNWYIIIPSIPADGFVDAEDGKKYFAFVEDRYDNVNKFYSALRKPYEEFMEEFSDNSLSIISFIEHLKNEIKFGYKYNDNRINPMLTYVDLLKSVDINSMFIEWLANQDLDGKYLKWIITFIKELLPSLLQLQGMM
jgi:hypothetical protein